ncbi:hypothetical protein B0T17DRAFT_512309 [Bombardia bombarda]|uniref:Uncharacterized protein n=1 Tax=Bombardia bombarda TaxID=252184 RepID=A0AA39WCE9_9PEZI|nr:hypothetical protein B0T17DRAFT_512309 [Bombardia bombarda]
MAADGEFADFSIDLLPTGDKGSSFRTQNDPASPYQRSNVIERKGAVDIRCSCVDVIHGLFDEEGDTFCTLVVLQFRFDPRKRARRIVSADIELRFASNKPGSPDPEAESVTQGAHLTLSAAAVAGAGLSGGVNWSRTVERGLDNATTVIGSIDLRGRNFGKSNCASWTLMENNDTKTGVPMSMTAAILLKRRTEEIFRCDFTMKVKADWRSNLETLFGSTPLDDPILFDPTLDPTNDKYDELNLGSVDMESIADITMAKLWEGALRKEGGDEDDKPR